MKRCSGGGGGGQVAARVSETGGWINCGETSAREEEEEAEE